MAQGKKRTVSPYRIRLVNLCSKPPPNNNSLRKNKARHLNNKLCPNNKRHQGSKKHPDNNKCPGSKWRRHHMVTWAAEAVWVAEVVVEEGVSRRPIKSQAV